MTSQDLSTQVRPLRFVYEQDMSEKAHGRRLTVQELLTDGSHNTNMNTTVHNKVTTVHQHNPNYHSTYPSQSRINVTQHQHNHLSTRDVDSENTSYPQHLNIPDKPDYPQLLTPSTSPFQ
ncbi:8980_t:CDS:2 [Paraglomus brasilianum]|uniref:8980_t:CDS:1 n=1 Tax=Paraglomus brasilianum TaxID=144538 RepID=A0A9N9A7W1_9GLOM|nr:8980_t:CDS:2 [Paraglomus brasilianum]